MTAPSGPRILAITTLALVAGSAIAAVVTIVSFDNPLWSSSTGSSVVATKEQDDTDFAATARGRIAPAAATIALLGAVATYAARVPLVRRRDRVS